MVCRCTRYTWYIRYTGIQVYKVYRYTRYTGIQVYKVYRYTRYSRQTRYIGIQGIQVYKVFKANKVYRVYRFCTQHKMPNVHAIDRGDSLQ